MREETFNWVVERLRDSSVKWVINEQEDSDEFIPISKTCSGPTQSCGVQGKEGGQGWEGAGGSGGGVKQTLSCSNSCQQRFPDQHQMDAMLPLAQGRTSAAPSHDSGGASAINQRLYGGSRFRRAAKNKIYTKVASQAAGRS